jgi:hypothetical protein
LVTRASKTENQKAIDAAVVGMFADLNKVNKNIPKCSIVVVVFLSDGIELDTSKFTPLIHGTSTTCGKPRWYIALIMNFRMKIKKTSQTKLNSSQNISFFRYSFLLFFFIYCIK